MFKRIMVGIDGSQAAIGALAEAIRLGRAKALLFVLSVSSNPRPTRSPRSPASVTQCRLLDHFGTRRRLGSREHVIFSS
ncbi:universal stress protein [Caballeronia sp. PC1]|uniref:universal stress protein n=1 Tax=Caballeronia sp. PC1 TaxID=2906765 RepID=UPI0035C79AE7